MQSECTSEQFEFEGFGRRRVVAAFAALAVAALLYPVVQNLRWPLTVALRHAAAAPNCTARAWPGPRLARPSYDPQHDRDRDGIACEPFPRH